MYKTLISSSVVVFISIQLSVRAQSDELLDLADAELKREMAEFAKASQPPYYLAYRITDSQSAMVTSSFGSLVEDNTFRARNLATEIKIGNYDFDDSHPTEDLEGINRNMNMGRGYSGMLPIDNRAEAIKYEMWQQTQRAYRQALNTYKEKKSATRLSDKPVDDFSKEQPSVYFEEPLAQFNTTFNREEWKGRIKKFSAPFLDNADIVKAEASIRAGNERKYIVNSEGTRVAENRTYAHLAISASIRTEDGDLIPLHQSYFAFDSKQLPTDEIILKDVANMISKLVLLRNAPVAEPYTGPAILYSHAAGVFFHEIFGHRVEGQRLKNKNDGQTFKGKVGEQVLLNTLSVIFDPSLTSFHGQDLNGSYQYDDEGMKGEKVTVVDKGILKTFLMSRTPIEKFSNSNGHGRTQVGAKAVSRQSNLLIENSKVVPMTELRKMLIEECKKQKKDYGYLFMDVVGGFTTTQRVMPNAFNIFPTEVYRIYVDGRADELVRGVDLIGTPLAMFSEIQAADDKQEVFTGFCGAESGSIPVTAISPSLFVRQIETQKKAVTQIEKTLLQRPSPK